VSAGSKPRRRSKAAFVGLIVAALTGLALWALVGREPPSEKEHEARAQVPQGRLEGEVVTVLDGDTIDVMHGGGAVRVRLAGIDCPEKRQPFGKKAKQRVADLVFDKKVSVDVAAEDRYGRKVGVVTLPDFGSLNELLVREGLAWWYRRYSEDTRLGALEAEARAARRGLWTDPHPTPPWEWRLQRKRKPKGDQYPR
jgi:micrococcal nuclease